MGLFRVMHDMLKVTPQVVVLLEKVINDLLIVFDAHGWVPAERAA